MDVGIGAGRADFAARECNGRVCDGEGGKVADTVTMVSDKVVLQIFNELIVSSLTLWAPSYCGLGVNATRREPTKGGVSEPTISRKYDDRKRALREISMSKYCQNDREDYSEIVTSSQLQKLDLQNVLPIVL